MISSNLGEINLGEFNLGDYQADIGAIAIGTGSLVLTGFAPSSTGTTTLIPIGLGQLTLTGYAPSVPVPITISIPAGSLLLTGLLLSVSQPIAGRSPSCIYRSVSSKIPFLDVTSDPNERKGT